MGRKIRDKAKNLGDTRPYEEADTGGEAVKEFAAPSGSLKPKDIQVDLDAGVAFSGIHGDRETVQDYQQLAGNVLQGHNGLRFSTGRRDGRAPQFTGTGAKMKGVLMHAIPTTPRHRKIDKAATSGMKKGARWRS